MSTSSGSGNWQNLPAFIVAAIAVVVVLVGVGVWWMATPHETVVVDARAVKALAPPTLPGASAPRAAPVAVEPGVAPAPAEPRDTEAERNVAAKSEQKPPAGARVAASPEKPSAAQPKASSPLPDSSEPVTRDARTSGGGVEAALEALRGRYVGNYFSNSGTSEMIGFSLVISGTEKSVVTGTAMLGGRGCNGDYPMRGAYRNGTLNLRSTRNGGPAGDCPLNLNLHVEGDKLVGATDSGDRVELRKKN